MRFHSGIHPPTLTNQHYISFKTTISFVAFCQKSLFSLRLPGRNISEYGLRFRGEDSNFVIIHDINTLSLVAFLVNIAFKIVQQQNILPKWGFLTNACNKFFILLINGCCWLQETHLNKHHRLDLGHGYTIRRMDRPSHKGGVMSIFNTRLHRSSGVV